MNLIDRIFFFVRNYSTSTYSLPRVCREVVEELKSMGYNVRVIDDTHRDYRTILVDGHIFRIIRNKAWCSYDVLQVV